MKSVGLFAILICRSVICISAADLNDTDSCNIVWENFNSAQQLHETKAQFNQILTAANFTVQEDDPDFILFSPSSENDEVNQRTARSHVLLKTAYLLKQNLPGHGSTADFIGLIKELSHCLPLHPGRPHNPHNGNVTYRPIDGQQAACPHSAGKSFEAYGRLEKPNYSDGLYDIPVAKSGNPLPSPRVVINQVVRKLRRSFVNLRTNLNMIHMFLGQYIAHDMGSRVNQQEGSNPIRCCSSSNQMLSKEVLHPACLPIAISPGDPDYPQGACLSIVRSEIVAEDLNVMCPAQQLNTVTSALDLSNTYGNLASDNTTEVRSFVAGKLLIGSDNILATRDDGSFFTGDARFIQTPHLAIIHSLFVRWHNYIAGQLAAVNPHWDEEELYQEARRINIAFYQNIVFEEYLKGYLHPVFDHVLDTTLPADICNDATFNEHAAAIFRVIHGFIPPTLQTNLTSSETIQKLLLNMAPLIADYNGMIRGMLMQAYHLEDYSSGLMHHLFSFGGSPGTSLPDLDVQRGRDHAASPYYVYLEKWTKSVIRKWEHLIPYMSSTNINLLKNTYESVQDVDLLIGLLLETPMEGTYLGPTTQRYIVYQFRDLKDRDPFWYTKSTSPKRFHPRELKEILKATTNTLICDTTDVKRVPKYPSVAPTSTAHPDTNREFMYCKYVPKIDYSVFAEKPGGEGSLIGKIVGAIINPLKS